jgi:pimeloyl-ACP methyl ester carboxylesterase
MALANGFPPQTYGPLLQPLTSTYRVVSLPPRGLWSGIGPPPEEVGTWRELSDDLLAGMKQYDLNNVIAVGHSFGAVASLLAVIEQPERFRALILLDPTIMPQSITEQMRLMRAQGEIPRFPLVDGALSRRHRFASVEEAFAYWRGKTLFEDWSDETLRIYAESMTRPAADNDGLELTWSREWEAYYYLSFYVDTWQELPRLNGLLPVLIIRGGDSNAYGVDAQAQVREILPDATHMVVPGYGHLFPQAAPDATRQMISEWLATLA